MPIKNILFDFDGVILDSMPIREMGFAYLFQDQPAEKVEPLLAYHRTNGGLSRYHKIRYFYENILGSSITDEEVLAHAARFSEIMRRELTNPELVIHDAVDFIKEQHANFPMHIVSGSDGEELRWLCGQIGIAQYFLSIEGSPTPKKQLVKDLMARYGYNPEETVLIGDSINDYEAAKVNGIHFLAYLFFSDTEVEGLTHLTRMSDTLNYC